MLARREAPRIYPGVYSVHLLAGAAGYEAREFHLVASLIPPPLLGQSGIQGLTSPNDKRCCTDMKMSLLSRLKIRHFPTE